MENLLWVLLDRVLGTFDSCLVQTLLNVEIMIISLEGYILNTVIKSLQCTRLHLIVWLVCGAIFICFHLSSWLLSTSHV